MRFQNDHNLDVSGELDELTAKNSWRSMEANKSANGSPEKSSVPVTVQPKIKLRRILIQNYTGFVSGGAIMMGLGFFLLFRIMNAEGMAITITTMIAQNHH